jgi:hypothetical protein
MRLGVLAQVQARGRVALFLHSATDENARSGRIMANTSGVNSYYATGTGTDWMAVTVVGSVARDADFLYYGVTYDGGTPLWMDDVRIAQVDDAVAVSEPTPGPLFLPLDPSSALPAPTNLDFDLGGRARNDRCRFGR